MRIASGALLLGVACAALITAATAANGPPKGTVLPLVAISRSTGAFVAFPRARAIEDQSLYGGGIEAVAADGRGGWYVGGDFTSLGNVRCKNLAHVRADLTVDPAWCPRPDDAIAAIFRSGGTLYVSGDSLSRIAGRARHGVAAFDIATGRLAAWNPNVHGEVYNFAASPDGSVIYLGGSFLRVGGKTRTNVAAVDSRSGLPTAFAPNANAGEHGDSVEWLAATRAEVYVEGVFTRAGGSSAPDGTAALDARTGRQGFRWDVPDGLVPWSGSVVVGDTVFVSGDFGRFLGEPRNGLAAFAGRTGRLLPWSPMNTRVGVDAITAWGNTVVGALTNGYVAAFDRRTGARVWMSKVRLGNRSATWQVAAAGDLVVLGSTP